MYRVKNTLGHITHPRRVNLNRNGLKFNQSIYEKYKKNEIKYELDGLSQTTYTLVSKETAGNVTYIKVKDIGVTEDFYYKELYRTALSNENKNNESVTQQKQKNTEPEENICAQMYGVDTYNSLRNNLMARKRNVVIRRSFRN